MTEFVGIQIEYSLIERTSERELLPMANALNIGVNAWSPLGGWVLTGKDNKSNNEKEEQKQQQKQQKQQNTTSLSSSASDIPITKEGNSRRLEGQMNWQTGSLMIKTS